MKQIKIIKQITNRNDFCVDSYLNEISKFRQVSCDEEIDLIRKIKQGDKEAFETLINANLRFVISVAKQYQHSGLDLCDLINEGNIGLIKAARKFDDTKGFKFISYAVWWIRQSILHSLCENGRLIRLPHSRVNDITKYRSICFDFEQKNNRKATSEEIAELSDFSIKEIEEINCILKRHLSMEDEVGNDRNEDFMSLMERIPNKNSESPDKNLIIESTKGDVERMLTGLSEKERDIIELAFGFNDKIEMTNDLIAEAKDYTSERVRQIKNEAIEKLRRRTKSSGLLNDYFN
jgi:RNA polymerase primary sigma factor